MSCDNKLKKECFNELETFVENIDVVYFWYRIKSL